MSSIGSSVSSLIDSQAQYSMQKALLSAGYTGALSGLGISGAGPSLSSAGPAYNENQLMMLTELNTSQFWLLDDGGDDFLGGGSSSADISEMMLQNSGMAILAQSNMVPDNVAQIFGQLQSTVDWLA